MATSPFNLITMTAKKTKLVDIKTKPTAISVSDYLNAIVDLQKRNDCFAIVQMMKEATHEEPVLWGSAIVGFGNRVCVSPNTGRAVEWLVIGFAPRKSNISLYLSMDMSKNAALLTNLGKHKTGVGCLYINKLADVDTEVLKTLIDTSLAKMKL